MSKIAKLEYDGKIQELSVIEGTEKELGVDVSQLRAQTGLVCLDEGFGNTASCKSEITFIDGDKGILRYRGIPIEEMAENSSFIETAYLLIWGHLPSREELRGFSNHLMDESMIHENMKFLFEGFPSTAHPMAILSAMINAMGCFEPVGEVLDAKQFERATAALLAKVCTIAACSYRKSRGLPFNYPNPAFKYAANFLHMMFSMPHKEYVPEPEAAHALDMLLLLHADHEQNCSTSTVRMVASSRANIYASTAAGVCALWGSRHGGANQAVLEMLEQIHKEGDDGSKFINAAKDKNSGRRLMGFGHRVYRNYDPRAKIIKRACDNLLKKMGISDPLLDIARKLEEVAIHDPYFVERKLYPNVDFYSGIILRALGIPTQMFTVMFSIGRMPGWIAQYKEISDDLSNRIARPRQIYIGKELNHFLPIEERG
ncbi:MAG: citrate synthase [Verrucomicrobiota bacterium]|nr:citrate synthase [Verrucomicrobiota bacterium]